ncbi:cytochrome c oxidase subunit 6C-like [Carcharodon carcharias]|uniref:cytochrome c oxidase subunit 6C-like n=1 Tax=Carcharodon carcharias TaxID=13397 RepID=UPI001B7DAAC0|nr:cytochrome c oxidase subunit 6C-like [Carcharodon carcharias]
MSSAVIAKPVMRGLLARRQWFHLAVAFALASAVAGTFKFKRDVSRMGAFADFYKKYDATKS